MGHPPSNGMGLRLCCNLIVISLVLPPSVISMPSKLIKEEQLDKKIPHQEAEYLGTSLWDFSHKDFDMVNILKNSETPSKSTLLQRFAKDIKFRKKDNFCEEDKNIKDEKLEDESSMESTQRSAARTIFEHFMMKGHQRYLYPLTIDYSQDRAEEGNYYVQ